MRLINVETLNLDVFYDGKVPPYAILSHTWGKDDEEISFSDIESGHVQKPGSGYTKLWGCCEQAKKDGYGYIWIDTCCIDKKDSVELGEAINSMFRWYQKAAVCYAYLSDVRGHENPKTEGSSFRASRWFERGWTLQELLAPKDVIFFGSDWKRLGTKASLCTTIESITRIPRLFLKGLVELRTASVAQRMAWAAHRQAKRAEDRAYSLLGIFSITMPMIYGEGGEQAFLRLQETIMRTTSDHSILAWGFTGLPQVTGCPALALSPSDFADSGHIVSHTPPGATNLNSISIYGGLLSLHLTIVSHRKAGQTLGVLNCGSETASDMAVGIPLAETKHHEFTRSRGANALLWLTPTRSPTLIHIKHEPHKAISETGWYFQYDDDEFTRVGLRIIDVFPAANWNREKSFIGSIPGQDCRVERLAIRIRHTVQRSHSLDDFVTIITLTSKHGDIGIGFESATGVCSRGTLIGQVIEHLPFLMQKAGGINRASNGDLSMAMAVEAIPNRPSMFDLRPICDAAASMPDQSFNITLELQRISVLIQLEKGDSPKQMISGRHEQLKKEKASQDRRIKRWAKRLNDVDGEIKALELRKERLAQLISKGAQHSKYLKEKIEVADGEGRSVQGEQHLLPANDLGSLQQPSDGGIGLRASSGETPLLMCARKGYTAEVEVLVSSGADTAAADFNGDTPLIHALRERHSGIVEILLATGGCVLSTTDSTNGLRALGSAAAIGNRRWVQHMLNSGGLDLSMEQRDGQALSSAIRGGHAEVVALLFRHNVIGDINTTDEDGHTPFFHAVTKRITKKTYILEHFRNLKAALYYPLTTMPPAARDDIVAKVTDVIFSPDSKILAIARQSVNVELRGLGPDSLRTICTTSHVIGEWVTRVAVSADSTQLAAGSVFGRVRVWVIGSWENKTVLSGHGGAISSLRFSQDSRILASGSVDETVRVWDCKTSTLLYVLKGHEGGVKKLAFSPDWWLATASGNGVVRVWNVDKNSRHRRKVIFQEQVKGSSIISLQYMARRQCFGAALSTSSQQPVNTMLISIHEIDVANRRFLRNAPLLKDRHKEGIHIFFSEGFTRCLTQSKGGLQVWDVDFRTGSSLQLESVDMSGMEWDYSEPIKACFSPDLGRLVAFEGIYNGSYRLFGC